MTSLFVIMRGTRLSYGTFKTEIASIWSNIELARQELSRIEERFNSDEPQYTNWRARKPIGGVDNLVLELRDEYLDLGDELFYRDEIFYSIAKHRLQA